MKQHGISPHTRSVVRHGFSGDFDLYKDAIVALSAGRKLTNFADKCVCIRRLSDNAEMDIAFVGGSIDEQAINDFGGYNLLGYTEDLSNSSWSVISNVLITHNKPDFKGGNNASQLDFSGTGFFTQTINVLSNTYDKNKIVSSIYIKGNVGETIKIENRSSGDYVKQKSIVFTGNWQRIDNASATVTNLGTTPSNTSFNLRRDPPNTVTSCLIYQPQVEINSTSNVTDYQPRIAGGASDCFVATLYDQSGNNNHATQAIADAQPKIYDVLNGEIVKENGKPAVMFDGADDNIEIPNVAGQSNIDAYFVNKHNDTSTTAILPNAYLYFNSNSSKYGFVGQHGSTSNSVHANYGTPILYKNNILFTGSNRDQVYDFLGQSHNIVNHQGANISNWSNCYFGKYTASNSWNFEGTLQDLIIFDTNLTTQKRQTLHNDINTYYKIY